MLDVDTAVLYLLDKRLINADAVVDGELTITSAARRNRNLRVDTSTGGYLIKQPDDPTQGGHHTLRAEAGFYLFCQQEPAAAAMAEVVPRLIFFDADLSLLASSCFRLRLLSGTGSGLLDLKHSRSRLAGRLAGPSGWYTGLFGTPLSCLPPLSPGFPLQSRG